MRITYISVIASICLSLPALGATTAVFSADPATSFSAGPFPSNSSTVSDNNQLTGLRVNLPAAENSCDLNSSSVCGSNAALNQLDGFSLNPRLMVCFSSSIDPTTLSNADVTRSGMRLQATDGSAAVNVNQLEYDPASNCAFAKPDSVLKQGTSYLFLVTSSLKDSSGAPVAAGSDFEACLDGGTSYCRSLRKAIDKAKLPDEDNLVAASLFTTLSATNWLEQVHRVVNAVPLFTNLPAGYPNKFSLKAVQSIVWYPAQSAIASLPIPTQALAGVDSVSFGLFLSPNYIATSGPAIGTIPQTPSGLPAATPNAVQAVSYHVFLPPSTGGKIPLVIYGHGLGDNQFGGPTFIASTLAQRGFATLGMEIMGHGFGQGGFVNVTTADGTVNKEWTPGRGVALTPGAPIGFTDGCVAPGAVAVRDCARQTVVDLFALVNTIRSTNGLGLNLDPNRIYYVGQSFGSTYGTMFHAVEPVVQSAVLNVGGGTSVDVARLAVTGFPLDLAYLKYTNPGLLGNSPDTPYIHALFNDSYPFRDQLTTPVAGALPIQAAFEAADWLGLPGDPLAYAAHLQSSASLAGVGPKSTLFQFGKGDLEVPNPTESELVRTAGGLATTTLFHYERALGLNSSLATVGLQEYGLPVLPHRILSNITLLEPANSLEAAIASALQLQVADFVASNGKTLSNPTGYLPAGLQDKGLFELPASPAQLWNSLGYPVVPVTPTE